MAFWIYMLLVGLLVPLAMIGFGSYFLAHAPKEINAVFGYRTARSMKNKDTWEFAHHYCGKFWRVAGWVMLPLSAVAMLVTFNQSTDIVGWVGAALVLVQLLVMLAAVFPTERALKRTFDGHGKRIG